MWKALALLILEGGAEMMHTGSSAFALENAALKEELDRLRALCGRAADALASWHPYLEMAPEVEVELVKDLRKAAE